MKWMYSCKEITEICCDEDRKLAPLEKLKFWMHLAICKACAAYRKQIEFISKTMSKVMQDQSSYDESKIAVLEKDIIEKVSKGA